MFFSEADNCWLCGAIVGNKPDGSVKYKKGRARTQEKAIQKKQEAERLNSQPHDDAHTVGEHLDHWLNDIAKPNARANTWDRYEQVVRIHRKLRIGGIPLRKLTVAGVSTLWADMGRDEVSTGNIKKCSEVLASGLSVPSLSTRYPWHRPRTRRSRR